MLLEIFQVAVKVEDWQKVIALDAETTGRLREEFDGMVLYNHILSADWGDGYRPISIAELERYGIINSITLHKEIK